MRFRTSLLYAVCCMGVCLFSACSATPTPTIVPTPDVLSTPAATEEPELTPTPYATLTPNTISFWFFGDDAEKKTYDELLAAFKARNTGTEIAATYIANQFAYRQRLEEEFAAGHPPDVVILNNRRYGFYALRNLLQPVGDYMKSDSLIQDAEFFPEAIEPFRLNGKLMCVPQNASPLVVYYNKDLFTQAGVPFPSDNWTWDEFLADAKALTRDTNGDGKTDQYGLGTEGDLLRLAPFIWQNGGEVFDNDKDPSKLTMDSPASLEALNWVIDFQIKWHIVPTPQDEVVESFETRFINGTLAMFINQRRGVGLYREQAKFDWDVAPLPRNKRAANVLQADAYCIPFASDKKERAWQFIEFAASAEGQTLLAASGRAMPSLRAVAESDAFLEPGQKPAHAQIFIDTLPLARAFPILITWAQIEEVAGEQVERAFHGTLPLDQILPRATERVNTMLKKR